MRARTHSCRSTGAFTLTELLVVIAVTASLGLLLTPALTSSRIPANAIICHNNLRQLTAGWALYAADNKGRICPARAEGIRDPNNPSTSTAQWVTGTMANYASSTNPATLTAGLLYPYVKDTKVYKCPADYRTANFPGSGGTPTVRSVSMNIWMNSVVSVWSPTSRDSYVFRRQSDILKPEATFLLIDVNPGSIGDGSFVCDPSTPTWIDLPATYHNSGAGISFCDGHAETRIWKDKAVVSPGSSSPGPGLGDTDMADLKWLQSVSTY